MSIFGRRLSGKAIAVLAAVISLGALLPALSQTHAREITLVTRGMAFYLEGDSSTTNPDLVVKAGERIRIVLRNEDRGMTHDFRFAAIDKGTELIEWNQEAAVTFEAPSTPGSYEYVCQPHRLMMSGQITVVP